MIRDIRAVILTLLPTVVRSAGDDTYFTGEGTAYTLGQVSAGNCNFMYDPGVHENYAALNDEQWDSTRNCGRCAEVSCTDSRCSPNTGTEIVYIVDRCPECKKGDLDLSPTVFQRLTGSAPARLTIKWKFVDCPVQGNIHYCTKSGSSSSWLALQPSNFAAGIASMKIATQDVTMVDSCYYFLLNGGSNVDMSAVNIELTSMAGETLFETLKLSAANCTEGTSNFGGESSLTTSSGSLSKGYDSFNAVQSTAQNGFQAGTVIAPNEAGEQVSILQSTEANAERLSSSGQTNRDVKSEFETNLVTTKSQETSSSTSPVSTALILVAAVACVALAAVGFSVKKKSMMDRRIDHDENLIRAFDTFSSPVRITERIAKL